MNREEIFQIWAPQDSIWSNWVKPVLFSYVLESSPAQREPLPAYDVSWASPVSENTALIIDLPGPISAVAGVSLANMGYRPVPLFNALPAPFGALQTRDEFDRGEPGIVDPVRVERSPSPPGNPFVNIHFSAPIALVDVVSILRNLERGSSALKQMTLLPNAPPAFLVDSMRNSVKIFPGDAGRFDNRSILFHTDFPSATFLKNHSIRRVIVCRNSPAEPAEDLGHVLSGWKREGIEILTCSIGEGKFIPWVKKKSGLLHRLWFRFLAYFRFRRDPLGGFGGIIPHQSGG